MAIGDNILVPPNPEQHWWPFGKWANAVLTGRMGEYPIVDVLYVASDSHPGLHYRLVSVATGTATQTWMCHCDGFASHMKCKHTRLAYQISDRRRGRAAQ